MQPLQPSVEQVAPAATARSPVATVIDDGGGGGVSSMTKFGKFDGGAALGGGGNPNCDAITVEARRTLL